MTNTDTHDKEGTLAQIRENAAQLRPEHYIFGMDAAGFIELFTF